MIYRSFCSWVFWGTAALGLAACSSVDAGRKPYINPNTTAKEEGVLKQPLIPAPKPNDGGVVLAESVPVAATDALSMDLSTADCYAEGQGVTVETTKGNETFLFDVQGKPCTKGEVMFDGKLDVNRRGPGLENTIVFLDSYGPTAQDEQEVKDATVPVGLSIDEVIKDIARQEQADNDAPLLEKTMAEWQEQKEREQIMRETERLLADVRNINRMSTNDVLQLQQDKIAELTAQLREAQQQVQNQKERQVSMLEKMQHSRQVLDADRLAWEQNQRQLRLEQEQLTERVQQLQAVNTRLQETSTLKEQTLKQQVAQLSSNLNQAEKHANRNRQELVLEAAKKIAEAEKLAYEAKIAEQEALQREALRLQTEADTMVARAGAFAAGRSIVVPRLEGVPALEDMPATAPQPTQPTSQPQTDVATPTLETVPVVIRAKDTTLETIFATIMKDIEPQVGKWDVAWELRGENVDVKLEKYNITAEVSFEEFLAYVADEVQKLHNVTLSFKRFDQSRLFVITDE